VYIENARLRVMRKRTHEGDAPPPFDSAGFAHEPGLAQGKPMQRSGNDRL
jgi:hypothetical protein